MPVYEYLVKDLFTEETVGELDLYGVFCNREMSAVGQFQGAYLFRNDAPNDIADFLELTRPGRYGLVMKRNNVSIWGGIIWSRSYSAKNQIMQIYSSTWESYFEHMVFWKNHFIQQKVAQETIFQNAVTQLQSQSPACDIGLHMGPMPTTDIKRTVLIPNYEYHFGIDAISQLVSVDLGLEYTITPDKEILLAAEGTLGEQSANPAMAYDFPGQIDNYWMPESGASGAVKLATLGAGSGNKIVRSVTVDEDAIAEGYPEWWKVTTYSEIASLSVLQSKNVADFRKYRIPHLTPTFDMKPTEDFDLNQIGSDFEVNIQDLRYPEGATFQSRMLGWELTPESADNSELLKVSIDGSRMVA